MADPNQPGRPGGALVVLHTDADASAERLAIDVLPRLGGLLTGKKPAGTKPGGESLPKPGLGKPAGHAPERDASQLGTVGGRSLLVYRRGRDVVIAWGDDALSASVEAAARPDRSVAPLCTDWVRRGKEAPAAPGRDLAGALRPARSRRGHHVAGLAGARPRSTGRLVGMDRTGRGPRFDPFLGAPPASSPVHRPASARPVSAPMTDQANDGPSDAPYRPAL